MFFNHAKALFYGVVVVTVFPIVGRRLEIKVLDNFWICMMFPVLGLVGILLYRFISFYSS